MINTTLICLTLVFATTTRVFHPSRNLSKKVPISLEEKIEMSITNKGQSLNTVHVTISDFGPDKDHARRHFYTVRFERYKGLEAVSFDKIKTQVADKTNFPYIGKVFESLKNLFTYPTIVGFSFIVPLNTNYEPADIGPEILTSLTGNLPEDKNGNSIWFEGKKNFESATMYFKLVRFPIDNTAWPKMNALTATIKTLFDFDFPKPEQSVIQERLNDWDKKDPLERAKNVEESVEIPLRIYKKR